MCCAASVASAADPKDPLARARLLYNQRQFEAALAAAEEGRRTPARADSADLIAARAYLERYRESAAQDDLASARDRLRRINPERFDHTERVELIIGLGEALYFDGSPGAAAALFDSALAGQDSALFRDMPERYGARASASGGGAPRDLTIDARERLLDWWASALDVYARDARDTRRQPDINSRGRQTTYQTIRERMQAELGANPASGVASYWLVAAARGQGDLEGAWDAAQAGWVRAPLASDRGAALRADLDRLIQRAIIPERARAIAQTPDNLRVEWDAFKTRWSK